MLERTAPFAEEHPQKKKWIAAICAVPMILGYIEIFPGATATISSKFTQEIPPERRSEECVVVDDYVITSRALGTAIEFTLEIIAQLYSSTVAEQLGRDILFER